MEVLQLQLCYVRIVALLYIQYYVTVTTITICSSCKILPYVLIEIENKIKLFNEKAIFTDRKTFFLKLS
jgi:hypothetical protein